MIKLKEGQKILGEDGNCYLIEKGDIIQERVPTTNEVYILLKDWFKEQLDKGYPVKSIGRYLGTTTSSALFGAYTELYGNYDDFDLKNKNIFSKAFTEELGYNNL